MNTMQHNIFLLRKPILRWTVVTCQISGKSPDDEDTQDTSLGRCPAVSRAADHVTNDCTGWKIAAGILAGLVFGLAIIIVIMNVSRCKQKNRISEQRNKPLST